MSRAGLYRVAADAATAGNALSGIGAIAYVLAGNSLFAMALLLVALGFDGLDGFLARRAGGPPSLRGRVLDSAADMVSFAVAPAVLLAVHSDAAVPFAPYAAATLAAGLLVGALAIARLLYFTARGYRRPNFVGASTPQTTLAMVLLMLFFAQPGYLGELPVALVAGAVLLAPLMVIPIPYPKIRRGTRLRSLATATSFALFLALLPIQFHPTRGSWPYLLSEAAAAASAVGIAAYYVMGPLSLRGERTSPGPEGPARA